MRHRADGPGAVGRGPGDGRQQSARRDRLRGASQHEHAGSVCRLQSSGRYGARAGERRLLIDQLRRQRNRDRPARAAQLAEGAERGADCRQPFSPQPERREQLLIPVSPSDCQQLGARRGREVRGEAAAEAVGEERVDGAEPQPAVVASAADSIVPLQQPCQLAGREVRIKRQA